MVIQYKQNSIQKQFSYEQNSVLRMMDTKEKTNIHCVNYEYSPQKA